MAKVQLFLSTVSAEFLSYRERLRHLLTRPDVEVKVQEDFIVTGDETLEMLDAYIRGCDGVIHLVGDMTGAMAKPQSVEAITRRYPDLASHFPLAEFLLPDGPSLSYTQWEAWLALLHGKKLYIATPEAGAPRDQKYTCEAGQQELQQAHMSRLRQVARYPGTAFPSQEHLAAEVLRSFVLDLLVKAGLSPIRPSPHNLPERTTSAERFVGRAQELAQLGSLLAPDASRVYLTGMGGVGKSELAIQYAYDTLDVYRGGILRLDARQGLEAMAQQVVTFFRGVFPEVALPEDRSPAELLPVCWSQWPTGATPPEPVLLILDDQPGDKDGYGAERQLLEGLPGRFRRLITQRESAPAGAKAIDLSLLQRDASLKLLALQAGVDGPARLQAEEQAAHALCSEVGDLPLALVLLGARLAERPDLRLEQLLADLQAKGAKASALRDSHPELGARLGVVESLLISWEPLSVQAKELAVLLGVMAPALIPWNLVEACRREDQELEEGSAFGEAQAELLKAQLLDRVAAERYQLHPLVRGFVEVQARGMESVRQGWRSQLAKSVAAICRERFEQVMTLERQAEVAVVVPHLTKVAQDDSDVLADDDLGWPFAGLARLSKNQADFSAALAWSKLCLQKCEERVGPNHPATASSLTNLALLLQVTNRLKEAEPLMRRSLAIDEASYGPDHPNVARDLNNLAQLLQATNRLKEAEPLMRRSLAIDEASYGADHPSVAIDLNNLALLLQDTNRLEEAEPLMRRALAIDEASYGPEHPMVAIDLNNLAPLLQATNRLEEAELLMRRSLAIDEASYGPEHPNVARDLNNLAQLLKATNRLAEAEPLMRRSLAIDEASYGADHPSVAIDLNNLALLLQDTNRLEEAEPLMRRSLAIDEASYGPDHPNVARDLNNLAQLLQATNRLKEAEPLMRRALAIDEASYGADHPSVAIDLNNLALLLHDTNRLEEAEPLMRRSLAIDEASYGLEHPNVARDLNNLAQLLVATNRLAEAEPLMRRSLAIDEASYGLEHPNVARDLNNLAQLLEATNRLEEAEPLMRRSLAIDEASYGPHHPKVAIRLNNLAQLLQATNRLDEAEPLMRRSLAIDEASYGPEHPDVAIHLNNLAVLLQATNRLEEAEPLMARVVEIFELSYGKEHPNVATALNNLAQLLQATNRLKEAEPLMRRALAIDQASYGPDHPNVATHLNNLATLLVAVNRLEEAVPLMGKALIIFLSSLGADHPSTNTVGNNYISLLQAMGLSADEISSRVQNLIASS